MVSTLHVVVVHGKRITRLRGCFAPVANDISARCAPTASYLDPDPVNFAGTACQTTVFGGFGFAFLTCQEAYIMVRMSHLPPHIPALARQSGCDSGTRNGIEYAWKLCFPAFCGEAGGLRLPP
jgi:hypothetical protein